MAQKLASQNRFIEERVRALAVVYLTRREDLMITEETTDIGIDLWVTLKLNGKEGHRKFGVELKGFHTAATADHANIILRPSMRKMLRYGPFPFPVVLFFYTMENTEGWYTWVAEPSSLTEDGFQLIQHEEASCRPLEAQSLDQIIETVDRWYDAFFDKATRERPVRSTKNSSA